MTDAFPQWKGRCRLTTPLCINKYVPCTSYITETHQEASKLSVLKLKQEQVMGSSTLTDTFVRKFDACFHDLQSSFFKEWIH